MTTAVPRRRRWVQPDRIAARRLLLRRLSPDDAEAVVGLAGDWEVARWTANIPHPYEPPMADSFLALATRQAESGAAWHFALTLPPAPRLIGIVSARLAGRPRVAELGYWLGRPWWGRGLMGEAVTALVGELRRAGVRRMQASAIPENTASIRIQERVGLALTGRETNPAPARGGPVEVEVRETTFPSFAK